MDKSKKITKQNVVEYAWKHYHNPQMICSEEFFEDMRIFFFVKKLLNRQKRGISENHHLTLNHIITLSNLFGNEATKNLLRFFVAKENHSVLDSFLVFLNILPLNEEEVKPDEFVLEYLRRL